MEIRVLQKGFFGYKMTKQNFLLSSTILLTFNKQQAFSCKIWTETDKMSVLYILVSFLQAI